MLSHKKNASFLSALFRNDSIIKDSEKMDQLRSNICNSILISTALLAIPAFIVSLSIRIQIGIKPLVFLQVFFVIALLVVYILRKHLHYWFRSNFLVFILFIFALAGMIQFGTLAPASILFILIPSLSVLLFNARKGIGMLLLIVLSFLVIATLDFKGYLVLDYNTDQYIRRSFLLIGYSIVYLISGVILFVSASISTNSLIKSFSDRDYIAKELRQFIEAVNSPIFGIDTKGIINQWNQATEQILGYKKDEVLGSDWIKFIPKSSGETTIKVVNDALKGKQSNNFEFITRAKNGQEVILLVNTSTRRDTAGEITGVLGVGKDITELVGYRNELELKVDQRTIKLNEALEKQKELNELKSRFVSTTSHEFRTPLSAINFAAGTIKKYWAKMEPSIIEKKLTKIEDQVAFMTLLLDDILIIGQVDAGKMRNNPLPINLGDFISEIIEEISISCKKSHEIVLIDTEELKSEAIFIDEKLGRNIFINLLSNAVKFSPDAKKVVIQLSSEEKYTVISITDFGIGIPKSELKKIFTPFTRGKNVDLIQGTGLGLSIVKEAIAAIGGKIILNSTEGDGTSFVVKIPKI